MPRRPAARKKSVDITDTLTKLLADRPRRTKVCLVGGGASKWEAPQDDPEWECWGLNDMHEDMAMTWDRWFALHTRAHFEDHYTLGWFYQKRLMRKLKVPVYVWNPDDFPDVPNCVPYPKEEVEALTSWGKYHCGSFDWMMALAILEGFEEIRVCGVSLMESSEPISSRACMEYWIGVAEGKGIKVDVRRKGSALMSNFYLVRTDNQYGPDVFHLCVHENRKLDDQEVVW